MTKKTDICIMDSKRQQKFSRLIQKDLGDIFQKESKTLFNGAFITITEVKVTPDLSIARIYMSFMLTKDTQGTFNAIEEQSKHLRNELAQRIRHQVRIIPELQFFIDNSAAYAAKMEEVFSKIVIPPATDEKLEGYKD
jgi:ribosome-binding factor A